MESNPNERRKHRRVSTRILLKYRCTDQFFTDYIQNISQGGIFVPTHDPLGENTNLEVAFALPGFNRLIVTQGAVVHSVRQEGNNHKGPSGMGIRFHALSETDQRLIDAYIKSLS